MAWTTRDLSVAEAAHVVGLPRKHLDVIISRTRAVSVLYSEKRKGRRWFSPRDIAVLRVAMDLERGGRHWATAIAQAFEHLEHPPPHGALLIVPAASVSARSGRVVIGLPNPLPSDAFITIPIGKLVEEIQESINGLAI